jgi:hypothetical protein
MCVDADVAVDELYLLSRPNEGIPPILPVEERNPDVVYLVSDMTLTHQNLGLACGHWSLTTLLAPHPASHSLLSSGAPITARPRLLCITGLCVCGRT